MGMLFVDSYLFFSVVLSSLNQVSCLLSAASFNLVPFVNGSFASVNRHYFEIIVITTSRCVWIARATGQGFVQ